MTTFTVTELNKLGDKQVKKWQKEHERGILKAAQSRSDSWQRCYEIWGKASLKFRYPVLHGALSREEKDAIRRKNRTERRRRSADSGRFMAQLECGWFRNWEEKFDRGELNPIPYALIDSCLMYDKTDKYESYYSMVAVRHLEERLASRMLLSDIPFDMGGGDYCRSAWPKP